MKEIIRAYDLSKNKMKMAHGSTRIVLRNPISGNIIKDIESENTFQSQILADLFENIPFLNQNNNRSWADMIGGIFLFRDSVPANSRFMNAGNVMIGNGYRDGVNNSTPLELGTFNDVDSFARFQNGKPTVYQVWDFNNNQANGRISSVCLTSKIGGAIGYGNASGVKRSLDWDFRSFSQDNTLRNEVFDDTDTSYQFYVNSDSTVTVTEIRRTAVEGSAFSGLSGSYTLNAGTFGQSLKAGYAYGTSVGNNKIRFVPMGQTSFAQGSTVNYYEFDTQAKTLEIKNFTVNYTGGISRGYYDYHNESFPFIFTRFGKVICASSQSNNNVVVINLSDNSYKVITGYNFVGLENRFKAGEIADGLIVIHSMWDNEERSFARAVHIADIVNDTVYFTNSFIDSTHQPINACNDKGMVESFDFKQNANRYFFKNPLYLATINNLTNPVVKDSTLTMRVMYTLEEA